MKLILLLALRSVTRNPRRTAISLLTVAFGVAALIVAGGFVDALLLKLREDTIHSQLGHIQIRDMRQDAAGAKDPFSNLLPTSPRAMAPVATTPGVRTVTPRLSVSGLISVGETTLSFSGQGVDPAGEAGLAQGIAVVAGTRLQPSDVAAAVLGEGLAASLGVKPGDTVALLVTAANGTFNATDVVVRGIFSTVSKSHDDVALRLPLATAQKLLRVEGAQQWLVLLDDTDATAEMLQRLRHALPADRYTLKRWDEDADFYRKTSELFARQFGFVRVIVLTIIVLSILNTMTMNVLERTREIGVMLALGDSRRRVLALFACEGALLGIVGAASGAALGMAAGVALSAVGIPMPPPPGMNHGFDTGIALSPLLVAVAAAIGAVAAALAAVPPALRGARLRVVDALRAAN
jgi:putative ABC transport system permease protein